MLFNYLGLGEDEVPDGAQARLHRHGLLSARLFRVQDGAAVRLFAVHPRQAADLLAVVQHHQCHGGKAGRAAGIVRQIFTGRRRCVAVRRRAHAGDRQQHRFLYRAADAGRVAPRHRLRRSVRPRSDAGAARAAGRRRGGRLPRRRRRARRLGHAQAFLARQFPVRARSDARQPRVQALPADRARARTAACGG